MKRAVLIFGNGASMDYGMPSVKDIGKMLSKKFCKNDAFTRINDELKKNSTYVNYEHIYHSVQELLNFCYASNKKAYQPSNIMIPFLENKHKIAQNDLIDLEEEIFKMVFEEISKKCNIDLGKLESLKNFLNEIKSKYIMRIYTTNHDDILWQADPTLYTGFEQIQNMKRKFVFPEFWNNNNWSRNSLFHLHGSIHMAYSSSCHDMNSDIGELFWYNDRNEAKKHSNFSGSNPQRMDGTEFQRRPIITGLDKLSQLQQKPFSYYYSSIAKDLMEADLIYVIGSGLSDLHINTWLYEARSKKPYIPLLIIDKWKKTYDLRKGNSDPQHIKISATFNIETDKLIYHKSKCEWLLSCDQTSAIWENGFEEFLNNPFKNLNVFD